MIGMRHLVASMAAAVALLVRPGLSAPSCVRDNTTTPVFAHTSSGFGFNPVTPQVCALHCATVNYIFVGVDEATSCFCALTLDGVEVVEAGECGHVCGSGNGDPCGGEAGVLSVWPVGDLAGTPSPYLKLAFIEGTDNKIEIDTSTIVSFTVEVDPALPYMLDLGDGSGIENRAATQQVEDAMYLLEGEYYITVREPWSGMKEMLLVVVHSSQNDISLQCPDLVVTGEPFACNFTRLRGSSPTLTVQSQEIQTEYQYTLPELESRVYGHTMPTHRGSISKQAALMNDPCSIAIVPDTSAIGEDEYLSVVDGYGLGGSTVFLSTMQETCIEPECPENGVRSCMLSQHLCGGTCREFRSSVCSGDLNITAKTDTTYTAITAASFAMPLSFFNISVDLAPLRPHSFFSISCGTGEDTSGASFEFESIDAATLGMPGDLVFRTDTLGYTMFYRSSRNKLMRFKTLVGKVTTLGPLWNCTQPSTFPLGSFTGVNSQELINGSRWIMDFKLQGSSDRGVMPATETHGIICQTRISVPTTFPVNVGSKSLTLVVVPFLTGAPIVLEVVVQDGKNTQLWNYIDVVPEGGDTYHTEYTPPRTGHFTASVRAENLLNITEFKVSVVVVPVIVQEEWSVVSLKPWVTPPGNINVTLTCRSSDDPPWTANFSLVDPVTGLSDGEQLVEVDPYDSAAAGFTFSTNLTFTLSDLPVGIHTLIANFSNEVSWKTFEVMVDIREAVSEISSSVGIQIEEGQDPLSPAELNGLPILPANILIVFQPIAGKGIPSYWGLFDENDLLLNSTNTKDETLYHTFPSDGDGVRNITVKAYAEAEGWVVAEQPLIFEVVNKIQGLDVTDFGIITPTNKIKVFSVSLEVFHPITCLNIDFNDGSPIEMFGESSFCRNKFPYYNYLGGPITNPFNVTHIYLEESLYNVTMSVVDPLITLSQKLAVVVAYLPCNAPEVWLPDSVATPIDAPQFMRSRPFRVKSDAIVVCNGTLATRKSWTITEVVGEAGDSVADVPVEGILPSWNFSEINVPLRFLNYGTYKFTYRLQLLASKIFPLFRTAYTYVKVVKSELQAVIIKGGMSKVSRGYSTSLVLDPHSCSLDPDWPEIKNFTYTWFCREITDPVHPTDEEGRLKRYNMQAIRSPMSVSSITGGGCFGTGPGTLEHSTGFLHLNTSSFIHADKTYELQVMVEKDTRFAVAQVLVVVMHISPPAIDIECADPNLCLPIHSGMMVNPSSRVALKSVCSDQCHSSMTYSWNITTITGEAVTEVCPQDDPLIEPCSSVVTTGKTSKDIAVMQALFLINPNVDKFKLTLTVTTPSGAKGEYVMTLVLNKPPTGGECSVTPHTGRSLIDTFTIKCEGWKDPEDLGVDQYVFFQYESTNGVAMKNTIISSTKPEVGLILPVGRLYIFCEIWDKFGTYVMIPVGSIKVELPTEDEVKAFNVTNVLEYLKAIGDQNRIGMILNAQASLRENAPWLKLDENSLADLTDEEKYIRLKDVAKSNTEALKTAKETMDPSTVAQLNVLAGVVMSTVAGIDQTEATAKTVDMEARETVLSLMEVMSKSVETLNVVSPQDLVPFLSSSISAMGSIMNGLTKIIRGESEASIPPTDVEAAHDWDYEVDIGNDVTMDIPLSREEMLQRNVYETTKNKAKEQVNKMKDMVQNISTILESKCVEGEEVLAQAPNGAAMRVSKFNEQVLQEGMTVHACAGCSAVDLPKKLCPSNQENLQGCNQSISISVVQWPVITYSYVPTSHRLSQNTQVVSADLFLNGKKVNVSNVTEGVIVNITRNPEELPEPVLVTGEEAKSRMVHVPFVYHKFEVKNPDSAVNIEISVNGSSGPHLVLLLRFGFLPTPLKYEILRRIEDIPTRAMGVHDLFLSGEIIKNRTGNFFLGVAVLKEGSDAAAITSNQTALTTDMLQWDMDGNYSIRIITSGCYYFDEKKLEWSSKGLEVVSTSSLVVQCNTSHLTAFGSGFFPTPNTISFEFIFASTGFLDNTTIYVTLAITLFIFLCLLLWARFKDKEDVKKRGVTPLLDNDVMDRYLYEIVVYTGSDKNASCDSKVQVILSGECGETDVRTLEDKERKIFRRNGIDSFVMAVPRPLGDLQYLRVWHDNSGEKGMASLQLAFISVRDLQSQRKTLFIANRWLALDHDDGEIDITLATSSPDQMTEFSHLYKATKQRGIKDAHIWFSVFFRPPRSRYTRVERVAVCAAFVYLTMVCSAMWYSGAQEKQMAEGFLTYGIFSLNAEKAAVGMASVIVVYPVVQLIIWLFRHAGPRVRPLSRAYTAWHMQQQHQREKAGLAHKELTHHTQTRHALSLTNTEERPPIPLVLGWWWRVVAWLLVLAVIGASLFFVWAYALQFGAEKTSRWITSLFVTFLTSLFVVEPLMVLFSAVVAAFCCKRRQAWQVDADDINFDELEPDLEEDEEWQHLEPLDPSYPRRVHKIPGNKDTTLLEELRIKLVKEHEMILILRDVAAYLIFVFMLMMLTYGERDVSSFRMVTNLRNAFIKEGDLIWDYKNKIKTSDDYWRWLKVVMMKELRVQRWYNGEPPYGLRGYLDDHQNRIMGYAILRQVRNKKACSPASRMRKLVNGCSGVRGFELEDHTHYCAEWRKKHATTRACDLPEFKYKTAEELQSFPSRGHLGWYGGGGYVLELRGPSTDLLQRLDYLQRQRWIDRHTRVVMLEFSVYNTNVNLFGIATIMAEFHPGGGIRPKWRFNSSPFLRDPGAYGYFILLNELGFVLATIFFTIREFWKCYKSGPGVYFSSYWNIAEITIILISYSAIAIYVLRYFEVERVMDVFKTTFGNGYVRMEYAALLDLYLLYAVGFIIFFSTVKFIKLLQFNKRINLLGLTLSHCWKDLQVFLITFGIIFFTFSTLFFTIFNLQLEEFSSILASLQMSFAMMLGKFDFQSMAQANFLSPVMFFVFSLSTTFILINLMLTIIIRTFTMIKNDLKNQPNKYDILDYISNKIMLMLGLREEKTVQKVSHPVLDTTSSTASTQDDPASNEFPEKIDVLLAYINDMYFNGQMDLQDQGNRKGIMRKKPSKMFAGFEKFFGNDAEDVI